jgi:hypothetical protein
MTVRKIIANLFREAPEAFAQFNAHNYAKKHKMVIDSIPLFDGCSAKILCDKSQFNILVMKNGKVLTARGMESTPQQTYEQLQSIYSHINLRGRARQDFDMRQAWSNMTDKISAKTGVEPSDQNCFLFDWK